jgi:hypothetical protein
MALQDPMLLLGLTLFTLVGFILKSLSKYFPDSGSSGNLFWKMMSQVSFVVIIAILWLILIFM